MSKKIIMIVLCLCTMFGAFNSDMSVSEAAAKTPIGTTYYKINFKYGLKKYSEKVPVKSVHSMHVYKARKSSSTNSYVTGSALSKGCYYVNAGTFYKVVNGKRYTYWAFQKVRKVGGIYIIDTNTYYSCPRIRTDKFNTYMISGDYDVVMGVSRTGVTFNKNVYNKDWLKKMSVGTVTTVYKWWQPGLIAG